MRRLFHLPLLLALGLSACAPKETSWLSPTAELKARTDHAAELSQSADTLVDFGGNGEWVVNLTHRAPRQASDLKQGTPKQLISYFDSRPRKELVVITLDGFLGEPSIETINRYFLARGYKRVVIEHGHSNILSTVSSDIRRQSTPQ